MQIESMFYYMFNLGFAIIFAVLSVLTFFMYMSRNEEFKNYRKSRFVLGSGFAFMTFYCVFRLCVPQQIDNYQHFWVLVLVSLIFSWLNYTAFLFLINSEHKVRRHFLIDGISPSILILTLGIIGEFMPSIQGRISIALGIIFLLKCIWMFVVTEKEWQRVNNDLMEVYDEGPEILWMRRLVWLTFILSCGTLFSWYVPVTHVIYDIMAPISYFYMVIKLVNFYPQKIEAMRGSIATTNNISNKEISLLKNLSFLEPKIKVWVDNDKYCRANITIKDVAIEIGTNHYYLSKYLNSYLNISFQVWLNTLRVEKSKTLLFSEDISIEEVAVKVGIPRSYNYSRWFKIVTGETPFQYRRNRAKLS